METHISPLEPEQADNRPVDSSSTEKTIIPRGLRVQETISRTKQWIVSRKKQCLIVGAFLLLIVGGTYVYIEKTRHVAVKQFTNVYSFVPEKISRSAVIQINVPEGVSEDVARASISFSPEIKGSWQTENEERIIAFKPNEPLRSGVYYAVNMDTGTVKMSGDFFVDEDPKIEAVFPKSESESHEDSEITIVFNRPMVPLTTLLESEVATKDLPITITPETKGTFKWTSTRNLQFIPETTLLPSSAYTIEIKEGLYSVDGLPIEPLTHTFTTRPLRYRTLSEKTLGYRSPIIVAFNQPVDLERTKPMVTVTKENGENIPIEITYGERSYYDTKERKFVTEEDKSTLFVYQEEDAHGRDLLWDFNTSYTVSVRGAFPERGTIPLEEERTSTVHVSDIVENVTAQSPRTSLVRPDLMDPQGTITLTFYDEVDKDASDIEAKGLKDIAYGERCKKDTQGEEVPLGTGCEKEADTRTLILSFDHNAFAIDEAFSLALEDIYTKDGFRINTDTINIPLRTYPQFRILRTYPNTQSQSAPLDGMYVCTNAPLRDPGEQGLSAYVRTNGYIVFGRWSESMYVEKNYGELDQCDPGQLRTRIAYGLLPQTDYTLDLSLTDAFGQSATHHIAIRTKEADAKYTRFHNLQQQYQVTTPDKTTLTYAAENLEYVDMHICKMSPEAFLKRTLDRYDQFTPPQGGECTDTVTKRISLPPRYWVNNYFQVRLAEHFPDPRGHYIITFSNPLYIAEYDENKQLYDRTYVSVTNLAVGKKEVESYEYDFDNEWSKRNNPNADAVRNSALQKASNLYWVNTAQTLLPVQGAVVTQYNGDYDRAPVRVSSGMTDAQGIARIPVHDRVTGAVISAGGDSAIVTDWADSLGYAGGAENASKTYIYTDRPIYRPGQTVHIRGIDRVGFDGAYEVWKNDAVPLTVYDARDAKVYDTKLKESDYGTFTSSFELPADAALGTYRIEAFNQSYTFSVEEYVPAAFKLETKTDKEEYVNGDTFRLDLQATYYFGVPLDEGTVSYAVTAQDYYFDRYTDEYFDFGSGWYYCYSCGYGDDFLFRGETIIDENGRATIERAFSMNEYFSEPESEGSKLVTVSITAKDINGRSVSTQSSFIVHKGEYYIGARTGSYFSNPGEQNSLRTKTVDTAGTPRAVKNLEFSVNKISWETFKRQEVDGGFYYHSEKKLTEVKRETIATNAQGDWSGDLALTDEGEYEIHVRGKDSRGNTINTTVYTYVFGPESPIAPQNNNYELDLDTEKQTLDVGDTATLLIKSPYPKAKALVTIERGTIYEHKVIDITGGLYLFTFPIKQEYAPNISASVLLLSPNPEVKYGSIEYQIGTKEKELTIEVTSNKPRYLPGEEVTLRDCKLKCV